MNMNTQNPFAPVRLVEKPWGSELWVAVTEHYALKVICFNQGNRSSLQYHAIKQEHIYIDAGRVRMELENEHGEMEVCELGPGAVIENHPGRKHRVEALEDCRLIEVSTPHLDDVVRVQDDFGRNGI